VADASGARRLAESYWSARYSIDFIHVVNLLLIDVRSFVAPFKYLRF